MVVVCPGLSPLSRAVEFSHERGFYDAPFELTLTTELTGGTIRFTDDGSMPGRASGKVYDQPIAIDTTTVVRAVEFEDAEGSEVFTAHTFLFLADVVDQEAHPVGYIDSINSARNGPGRPHTFDWAFDPEVVEDVANNGAIADHLEEIPALVVAMDVDELNEIYGNHTRRGVDWERAASIELIYPEGERFDGFKGFQITCGIRMQGGGAGDQARKKSFRLLFKDEYGKGKLEYPLFESAVNHALSGANRFDGVVLRAAGNTNWSKDDAWKHEPSTYLRDPLVRDSQISVSGFGSRSIFVHLYINKYYFGLYNVAERPDDKFMAAYFGGDQAHYYSINHGGTVDGSSSTWRAITRSSNLRNLDRPDNYSRVAGQIDIEGYCDYVILNWLVGMGDWPWNNFYGGIRNEPEGKLRFFSWDSEYAFWTIEGYLGSNPQGWVAPRFASDSGVISTLWRALAESDDFLMTFADRVHKHCSEGGALSDAELAARFQRLADYIEGPIVAESAKWGDSSWGREDDPHTRKDDWYPNVQAVLDLIDGNVEHFIDELREEEYYPETEPPAFSVTVTPQEQGTVVTLTHSNRSGEIYYTLDSTDPRLLGTGGVSPSAVRFSEDDAVTVTESLEIKARVRRGSEWSPLSEQLLLVEGDGSQLRISELMYHPEESEAYEFVELHNSSSFAVDLSGFFFDGIDYRFPPGTVFEAGATLVLAPNDDPAAFAARYPSVDVFGEFRGHLDNAGEEVSVYDPQGDLVASVTYDDTDPWPTNADGGGFSLEFDERNGATEWRSSAAKGGTPGVISEPNRERATFQLSAKSGVDGTVQLEFEATGTGTHFIQYSDDLGNSNGWQMLTEIQPQEAGAVQRYEDRPGLSVRVRYYRVFVP